MNDKQPLKYGDAIEREIERRRGRARLVAKEFPDLKGKTKAEFYPAIRQAVPDIDFITAAEAYRILNAPN